MTNVILLKKKIEESGYKMSFIAEYLGISRTALYNKVNGKVCFNQYEIKKMCEILEIKTLREKEDIFFAH